MIAGEGGEDGEGAGGGTEEQVYLIAELAVVVPQHSQEGCCPIILLVS